MAADSEQEITEEAEKYSSLLSPLPPVQSVAIQCESTLPNLPESDYTSIRRGDSMLCPECARPMVVFELEGIEIDRCVACGGTWLDAGELERIGQFNGASSGRLTDALLNAKGRKHGKRRCPRCRRKLQIISVQVGNPIELDRCPYGDGLWFDKGEMEALIQSFTEAEEGAVGRHFAELFKHELKSTSKGE